MRHEGLLLIGIMVLLPIASGAAARPTDRPAIRCAREVEGAVGKLTRKLVHCRLRATRADAGFDATACARRARGDLDAALKQLDARCSAECSLAAAAPVADSVTSMIEQADARLHCSGAGDHAPARVLSVPIAGPADCGGPGFATPALPPFSGEVDAADGTKLGDLTLGCVYLGGGQSPPTAPAAIYVSGPMLLDVQPTQDPSRVALVASTGDGPLGCTKGAGPSAHCLVFGRTSTPCTTDADCGSGPGACQPDANCFTTSPLDEDAGGVAVCLVNVVRGDDSGTLDVATGAGSFLMPLSTRVYVGAPCPRCVANRCADGKNTGGACATAGTSTTSIDCPPSDDQFFGAIDMTITSTTGTSVLSADAAGVFCPGQPAPGAFDLPVARTIVQQGTPAGSLTDFLPHEATTVITTCIPPSQNNIIATQGGLPFPLAVGVRSLIQLQPQDQRDSAFAP